MTKFSIYLHHLANTNSRRVEATGDRLTRGPGNSYDVTNTNGTIVYASFPDGSVHYIIREPDPEPEVVPFRLADEVIIDYDEHRIIIDGQDFPYYLTPIGPGFTPAPDRDHLHVIYLHVIYLPVLAATVETLSRKAGNAHYPASDSFPDPARRPDWTPRPQQPVYSRTIDEAANEFLRQQETEREADRNAELGRQQMAASSHAKIAHDGTVLMPDVDDPDAIDEGKLTPEQAARYGLKVEMDDGGPLTNDDLNKKITEQLNKVNSTPDARRGRPMRDEPQA